MTEKGHTEQRNDVPAALHAVQEDAPTQSHGASLEHEMRQDDQSNLDDLVATGPYIREIVTGTVLAIDSDRKRCSVGTPTLQGDGGQLKSVCYGDTPPEVGSAYAVRISSDPSQAEHWIKVGSSGGADRWLYHKNRNSPTMFRYGWPPPKRSQDWVIETVQRNLPLLPYLFCAATSPEGDVEAVFEEWGIPTTPYRRDGQVYTGMISDALRYTHYADRGFGRVTKTYFTSPPDSQLINIAHDGYNSAGWHYRYTGTKIPGGTYHGYMEVEGSILTCCQPLFGEPFCIEHRNSNIIATTGHGGEQTFDSVAGVNIDKGTLGTHSTYTTFNTVLPTIEPTFGQGQVVHHSQFGGAGCHFIYIGGAPIALVWDTESYIDDSLTLPPDVTYVSKPGMQPYWIPCDANAWHRNHNSQSAWVVQSIRAGTQSNGYWPTALDSLLIGDGISGAQLPPLDPHYGVAVGDCRITYHPDNYLEVWAETDNSGFARWSGINQFWKSVPTVDNAPLWYIYAISPDGQDIIGASSFPNSSYFQLVWSNDGGKTWAKLPNLPEDPENDVFINGNIHFLH